MDQEILDTLAAAKLYLSNLNNLKSEIRFAEQQVLNTFEESKENIDNTFDNLKTAICKLLENRQKVLIKEAQEAKSQGLLPLQQCTKVLQEKIQTTNNYIDIGRSLEKINNKNNIEDFLGKASFLGSLPEVPELKEVPYISFYYDPANEKELENLCSSFGEIFRIAPIQIRNLHQKPGAILVEWQQSIDNEDKLRDIQEFRLQKAFGDVNKEKKLFVNFTDCYRGVEPQYLLRDIQISQPYSFRICCKFDGTSEWSPWSVTQVGMTELKPFSWEDDARFMLSDENKIVSPLTCEGNVLYSKGAQVSVKDAVEFTILSIDKTDAILGLVENKEKDLKDLRDFKGQSLLLDQNGKILVEGVEKATVLPEFKKGLKICFTFEQLKNYKIRVSIDSSDKRVTYDWPTNNDSRKFYFVCQLKSSQWKVMVE